LAAMNPSTPGLTKRLIKKYAKVNGYPATEILNIYDRPLIRKIEDFATDISRVCIQGNFTLDLSKY
jgi:hypothetical protein